MKTIDLNCDMGELKSRQEKNYDNEIMPYISSCNIACGFHSGSPQLIEKTILSAIANKVKIGAHPSYNDRENFGRVSLKVELQKLMAELRYQICAVKGMVESFGQTLNHVKPHGALYNDMVKDEDLANSFVKLVKEIDPKLKIFALAHSRVVEICKRHKMKPVSEGFADRKYQKLNQLRSRELEGAVLHKDNEVLKQVGRFLKGKVEFWGGTKENINIETLCLHSDTEGALELSKTIHHFLKENNVQIAAIG